MIRTDGEVSEPFRLLHGKSKLYIFWILSGVPNKRLEFDVDKV